MLSIIRQLNFPPIPLASGDTVASEEGTTGVRGIEIVITLDDGREKRLPLDYRLGGWWLSPDAD